MSIALRTWIIVLFLSIVLAFGIYILIYDDNISNKYISKTPCELNDPDYMEITKDAIKLG